MMDKVLGLQKVDTHWNSPAKESLTLLAASGHHYTSGSSIESLIYKKLIIIIPKWIGYNWDFKRLTQTRTSPHVKESRALSTQ